MDKPYYCLLLVLLLSFSGFAQNSLDRSRQRSFYTYIYPIDEANLERLYNGYQLDERVLVTPIDSFKTDGKPVRVLPTGNFVKVYVAKDELHYSLIENRSAYLKVLDHRADLQFIVVDVSGYLCYQEL